MSSSDIANTVNINVADKSEPLLRNFIRYLIPSIVALLSVSTAAVVDGLMVARFIGPQAVAAVNLLIPPMTLMFGLSLMFAIGGSIQAAYHAGENKLTAAHTIFSNTLLVVALFAVVAAGTAFLFRNGLFRFLGATADMMPVLDAYFCVFLLGVPFQLLAVVFYYFVRSAGRPRAATSALLFGAGVNIALDLYLLGVLRLGIASAAWATVAAQFTQFVILLSVLVRSKLFCWKPNLRHIPEVVHSGLNGLSEFINEISVGLVIGLLHWLLIRKYDVNGVAGFALINYALFINAMVCCAVAEVVFTLASQNIGAGNLSRARQYLRLAAASLMIFTGGFTLLLLGKGADWFSLFLPGDAAAYAAQFLGWLWPAFLLAGLNMLISAWFTGCRAIRASTVIAVSRSLFLPILFLTAISLSELQVSLVAALPAAELITFGMALWLWVRAQPQATIKGADLVRVQLPSG